MKPTFFSTMILTAAVVVVSPLVAAQQDVQTAIRVFDDDSGTCYYDQDCQGDVRFSNGSNWICGDGQSWRSDSTGSCINH